MPPFIHNADVAHMLWPCEVTRQLKRRDFHLVHAKWMIALLARER
jgi:hypothetical protein